MHGDPTTRSPHALRPAAFLDRDGVINLDHGYVAQRAAFDWVPGVRAAAAQLHAAGFALVVVTNQSGIGRGLYDEAAFNALTDWMRGEFAAAGAPLAGVYFCPHHPTEAVGAWRRECTCRKPAPGLLLQAARDLGLDLARSLLFGDRGSDLQAAQAAGVPRRVLLATDGAGEPAAVSAGLATHRFRSLADAVASMDLRAALVPTV
jgi:D-glycero-D-manno-heptose 1,7-bisphosphate phosphatase